MQPLRETASCCSPPHSAAPSWRRQSCPPARRGPLQFLVPCRANPAEQRGQYSLKVKSYAFWRPGASRFDHRRVNSIDPDICIDYDWQHRPKNQRHNRRQKANADSRNTKSEDSERGTRLAQVCRADDGKTQRLHAGNQDRQWHGNRRGYGNCHEGDDQMLAQELEDKFGIFREKA